jgi:hypothetical protein
MNDGIYKPFDNERFLKFKEGIQWLHELVARSDTKIIHITPPVYDELKGKKNGYESVLQRYSIWLTRQRDSLHWEVIDIHSPMKKYLDEHRHLDSAFALANDGVHPGALGHWLMAKQILLYLGVSEVANVDDPATLWNSKQVNEEVYKLVASRQAMMKDAWLSATKHQRPGMKAGIPLDEALKESTEIEKKIRKLVQRSE